MYKTTCNKETAGTPLGSSGSFFNILNGYLAITCFHTSPSLTNLNLLISDSASP